MHRKPHPWHSPIFGLPSLELDGFKALVPQETVKSAKGLIIASNNADVLVCYVIPLKLTDPTYKCLNFCCLVLRACHFGCRAMEQTLIASGVILPIIQIIDVNTLKSKAPIF